MSSEDADQGIARFRQINHELANYDPELLKRPQIVVATKMDMPNAEKNLAHFKAQLATDDTLEETPRVFPISAVKHQGIQQLMQLTADLLDQTPAFDSESHDEKLTPKYEAAGKEYKEDKEPAFTISRDEDGTWVLGGTKLLHLFDMTDLNHEQSQLRFARQMRQMGVDDALRERGVKDGDLVRIRKFVFEFIQ
jgi:GTP-binding protein